jgi:hypothetical protein
MVISKSTASPSPSAYRVDTARGDQGNTYHVVMRCEPVARFDDAEHAAFLVDLLTKGGAHHG